MNELWAEFLGSPAIIAVSVAYFLVVSVATFDMRIVQAKRSGNLPSDFPDLPTWTRGFHLLEWGLLIALLVMNWKLAIAVWVLCFILKVLPVMETIGNILMSPFKSQNQEVTDQSLLLAFKGLSDATFEFVHANEGSLEEQASELVDLMEAAKQLTEQGIEIPADNLKTIELTSERISNELEIQGLRKELEDKQSEFNEGVKEDGRKARGDLPKQPD